MTAGWKDDAPSIGRTGGNILRSAGGAEPIVFGADRQDRTGDLLDQIRLMRGSGHKIELHPCHARTYRQKVFQNLADSRLFIGVGSKDYGLVCPKHRLGQSTRHDLHKFQHGPCSEIGVDHRAGDSATKNGHPCQQVIGGDEKH